MKFVIIDLFLVHVFIFFSQIVSVSTHDTEPRCSKFDFEEKVLEKMVRLEHKTGLMMDEFRELRTQITSDVERMKRANEDLESFTEKGKEQIRALIEAETERFREETKSTKAGGKSYAFSAFWISGTSLSSGEVIVFQKKLLDESESFDNRTGKYTAPVSGTYLFTSTLCSASRDYGKAAFVADGERFGAFDSGDRFYQKCSSGSAITRLQKNSKVWLICQDSFNIMNSESAEWFNYFAGSLIQSA